MNWMYMCPPNSYVETILKRDGVPGEYIGR